MYYKRIEKRSIHRKIAAVCLTLAVLISMAVFPGPERVMAAGTHSISATTANGSVKTYVAGTETGTAEAGQTVTVRCFPDEGYPMLGLFTITAINGETSTDIEFEYDATGQVWTFTMPDSNVLITANFQPQAPEATKTLTPNGDGTYTLALNVKASAGDVSGDSSDSEKVNVILIMDRSNSMNNNNVDGYYEWHGPIQGASDPTKYGYVYYTHGNGTAGYEYRELTYSNGKYYYKPYHNAADVEYTGTVYGRTRLVAESDALSSMVRTLLSHNADRDGARDIVELSVISFGTGRNDETQTYGNTTAGGYDKRTTNPSGIIQSTNYSSIMSAVYQYDHSQGTNWEEAMQYAKSVADGIKTSQPNEDVYILFLTDGEPTTVNVSDHSSDGNWVTYDYSTIRQHFSNNGVNAANYCLAGAEDDAKAIVDEGYKLYGVFTYGSSDWTDHLKRLVNYAYNEDDSATIQQGAEVPNALEDYFFDAKEQSDLVSAIERFLADVFSSIAYGNVDITDGVTLSNSTFGEGTQGVTSSTIVSGHADGFIYEVRGEGGGVLYSAKATGTGNDVTVKFQSGVWSDSKTSYDGTKVSTTEIYKDADGVSHTATREYYHAQIGSLDCKMTLATVDNDGKVDWDLSGIGTLLDKHTYTVKFIVWPNQEAYDYVAGLNNGLTGYVWDESKQIDCGTYYKGGVAKFPHIVKYKDSGLYAALTNTEQELSYDVVSTVTTKTVVDGVEHTVTEITHEGPFSFELPTPEPMELKTEKMEVKKIWDDSINTGHTATKVEFYLLRDGGYVQKDGSTKAVTGSVTKEAAVENAFIIEVTADHGWVNEFNIAPGIVKFDSEGKNAEVFEYGHEYTVEEKSVSGGSSYYDFSFEYGTQVVRPMVMGSSVAYFALVDDYMPKNAKTYDIPYRTASGSIETHTYYILDAATSSAGLFGYNHKTSELDITKLIDNSEAAMTDEQLSNETFTFRVTMKFPDGSNIAGITAYEYVPRTQANAYTLYGYQSTEEENSAFAEDVGRFSGKTYRNWNTVNSFLRGLIGEDHLDITDSNHVYTKNGAELVIDLTITQNEVIRFTNLPTDTEYVIQEIYANKYPAVVDGNDSNKDSDKTPIEDASNIAQQGYVISEVKATDAVVSGTALANDTVTGKVVDTNKRYYNLFMNKALKTYPIDIIKVDSATGEALTGAQFSLYPEEYIGEDGKADPEVSALMSELNTDGDGRIPLGVIRPGTYYLVEDVAPVAYNKLSAPIKIRVGVTTASGYTINTEYPTTEIAYGTEKTEGGQTVITSVQVKVKNSAGKELPEAGGTGTASYRIAGALLTTSAAAYLAFRRRRKGRTAR